VKPSIILPYAVKNCATPARQFFYARAKNPASLQSLFLPVIFRKRKFAGYSQTNVWDKNFIFGQNSEK
jgi:hypothetical protein